jgi:hypothetical protein
MKKNKPVIDEKATFLNLFVELPDAEPDPEMLEIEEAKKLFDEQAESDSFWAGRTLAERKSARIAA